MQRAAPPPKQKQAVRLPEAPALVLSPGQALWLSSVGEVAHIALQEAAQRLAAGPPPFVCHTRTVARRLGISSFHAYDVLELFAFTHPAVFCLPTTLGLADALDMTRPKDHEEEAVLLLDAAAALLLTLAERGASLDAKENEDAAPAIAAMMAKAGWIWGEAAAAALPFSGTTGNNAFAVWTRLKEWQESPPPPPAGHFEIGRAHV